MLFCVNMVGMNQETVGKFLIYGLVDPRTGEIRYVGRSSSGMGRPGSHRKPQYLEKDRSHKGNWVRKLLSLGLDYSVTILEEVAAAELSSRERFWIAEGRRRGWPLTNLTDGGEGMLGYVWTEGSRAKAAASKRGRKQAPAVVEKRAQKLRGKVRTPEHLEHYREAWKRRTVTPAMREHMRAVGRSNKGKVYREHIDSLAELHRGRPLSAEHRAKIGAGHRGLTHTRESKIQMSRSHGGRPVVETTTGVQYPTVTEAAQTLGIRRCDISAVLHGHQKTVHGYCFCFCAGV
jgi:hypothetical protein